MNVAKDANQLVKAMYDHEMAISRLYGAYAARFPDYKDFWLDLSGEETGHADCLNQLWQKAKEGSEFIVVQRFSMAALDTSIKYVKKLIDKAGDANFELINAFSLALHIEEAMIENKYFEVFEGDSPQTVHVLDLLASETRKHFQKIKDVLNQYKQKGM